MTEKESSEPTELEHGYLDASSTGHRTWVLVIGALVVLLALSAAFYGLYSINQNPAPTLSPTPAQLTQAALVATAAAAPTSTGRVPALSTATPTLTDTRTITTTVEPPTYTVRQGDTLIAIAQRLNVNVDQMMALNQLSGETIFPDQVLLVPPTVTPWPETGPFSHIVSGGETLISIAARYNVTVQELKTLNGLSSDTIFAGQRILIPASGIRPPTPTPTPEPWVAAIITGDLEAVYSLTAIKGHFTLHIPPDTRAASVSEISKVARLVETALDYSQQVLLRRFPDRFDVYVTDTLFEAPYTARRSFSLADERRLFVLYDGSGTPSERLYFVTYALTRLIAAQTLGEAASPLLDEGLAVYVAGQALGSESASGQSYLSSAQFCAALQQAGKLPHVSDSLIFEGYLGQLDQYLAVGCFVGYLIETEGEAALRQVFLSGDYDRVYGKPLARLEADWIAALQRSAANLPFDVNELVGITTAVDDAYRRLWADFQGTPAQFAVYERLDRARMALLQGRLSTAQEHLDALETLLGDQQMQR